MTVQKVISGGQCGADVAGLRAAKILGLETGGWIPLGFKTKLGPRPEYADEFGLRETASDGYPVRTELNVLEADATVRFAWDWNSAGERLTQKLLIKNGRTYFDVHIRRGAEEGRVFSVQTTAELREWLEANGIRTLNVAGNASPWIEEFVTNFLLTALAPQWPPYEC